MESILILGASATQVPLIKCAKRLGYYVYVASIPGAYPGFEFADESLFVNTTDKDALLEFAEQKKIKGVATTGTDVAVRSIGYINSHLGLHGISEESSLLVTNKARMKEAMKNAKVNTADFIVVRNYKEAEVACKTIGFPVMVKCTDQAASKGISKVESLSELEEAVKYAFEWTREPYILIEECIIGHEVGLDGYMDDRGKCYCFPHNKVTFFNGLTNVPIGHSVPYSAKNPEEELGLIEEVEKCARALHLRGSFFNTDVMIKNNRSFILEMGGRTGSTCIPDMLSKYCGFDYYEKIIENAVGKEIDFNFKPQCACAAGFLMAKRHGIVQAFDYSGIQQLEGVDYSFDIRVGDETRPFMLGNDRIGQVICVARNTEEAEERLKNVQDSIINCIQYK